MKILVTGAGGYIGNKLAPRLANQVQQVHALVRQKATCETLAHPNITLFKGDILQRHGLRAAMQGCPQVYHTVAKVGAWARNPAEFYEVSVAGTRQVLSAALDCGVERTVITSTCGMLGPAHSQPVTENDARTTAFAIGPGAGAEPRAHRRAGAFPGKLGPASVQQLHVLQRQSHPGPGRPDYTPGGSPDRNHSFFTNPHPWLTLLIP